MWVAGRWKCSVRVGDSRRGNSIAEVYLGGKGALLTDRESVEANARLIAAAPAMLEALEDAARDAGLEASCASKRDDDFSVKAWAELQNKLDVVIRLAKGETK